MRKIIEYFSKRSKPFLTVFGILFVILVGIIRYVTGPEFALSLFFLLPIFLVTWFVGRNAGILISLLSAVTWLAADLMLGQTYSSSFVPYVNETLRLSVFLIVVYILSTLKIVLEREKMYAREDFLTGIANRQAFFEYAAIEIKRCLRYYYPLTIVYIDCDNFKVINDNLGHQTGDTLLQVVAETLEESIRATDVVARLGGDEFALLLPDTKYESARTVLQKIQRNLLEMMHKNGWPVTFSFGVVTFNRPPMDVDELINSADALMYAAKQEGKNTIKQHEVNGEAMLQEKT